MERSLDDYDLTGLIQTSGFKQPEATGGYSYVYRGKLDGEIVAIKVIRNVGDLSMMRRKVKRERTVWAAVHHPNILPFYGHAEDEKFEPFGAFISPWYPKGDAGKFLEQHGDSLHPTYRLQLWTGTLSGVQFLHGCNPSIVHGDLKPGNVLIDDEGNPRICDFGLARIIREEEDDRYGFTTTTQHTGTERYLSPELLDIEAIPTTASDVYALGCLGLEFIYSKRPYSHLPKGRVRQAILDGVPPATHQAVTDTSDDIWDLLKPCWNQYSFNRPSASELLLILWDNCVISINGYDQDLDDDDDTTQDVEEDTLGAPEEVIDVGRKQSEHDEIARVSYSNLGKKAKRLMRTFGGLRRNLLERNRKFTASATTKIPLHQAMALRDCKCDLNIEDDLVRFRCTDTSLNFSLQVTHSSKKEYRVLSCVKGEMLNLFDRIGDWWTAVNADGKSGLVPSSILWIIYDDGMSAGAQLPVLCRAMACHDCPSGDGPLQYLSLSQGTILDIYEKWGEWWVARKADGTGGLVPRNYLWTLSDDGKSLGTEQRLICRAKALREFTSRSHDPKHLSVAEGEMLDIFATGAEWWTARKANGMAGIVPTDYLLSFNIASTVPLCQVRALAEFTAMHPKEVSFMKGDTMEIFAKNSDLWWSARKSDGTSGTVPSNLVEVL